MLRALLLVCCFCSQSSASTLEEKLARLDPIHLAALARTNGDAKRGAILFHQPHIGCVKCHAVDGSKNNLGPNLTNPAKPGHDDAYVVTSVLKPSSVIRRGFESATVITLDGKSSTGLIVNRSDTSITLRDPLTASRHTYLRNDLEEVVINELSLMPAGLTNQLQDQQQFFDLIRYVLEIRDGGTTVAAQLQPPPGTITLQIPDYEKYIDHAGLIQTLNDEAFRRGKKIYDRLCINCHGNLEKPGSLPTALRFAEGRFRHGSDPYTMYKTLTHGFGFMVAQSWMVPRQKYDVIHYIREHYVRDHNPEQYFALSDMYLDSLPKGGSFGPEPVEYAPWSDMNYGPSMINTFEVGSDGSNFAFKGIAVRLDPGPGGIAKGNHWAVFDHDTMRLAAFWSRNRDSKESGFINWEGIHFDGRHGRHPRIVGDIHIQNPTGPGWANPQTRSFVDDQRVIGRDGKSYGPLPREWAKYRGLHTIGNSTIVDYVIGQRRVLEQFGVAEVPATKSPILTRSLSVAAANRELSLLVGTLPNAHLELLHVSHACVLLRPIVDDSAQKDHVELDGSSYLTVEDSAAVRMHDQDFTITARIRTTNDGTIFSKCFAKGPWTPDGKSFFIRDGRLTYDIGWVGAVRSQARVADGKWHDIAMTWRHQTGRIDFFIDGKASGGGRLKPKNTAPGHVAKIGFSSDNFPASSLFNGDLLSVEFYSTALTAESLENTESRPTPSLAWDLSAKLNQGVLPNTVSNRRSARLVKQGDHLTSKALLAGVIGDSDGYVFALDQDRLVLEVPNLTHQDDVVVWTTSVDLDFESLTDVSDQLRDQLVPPNLFERVKIAASPRWPYIVNTKPAMGDQDGPFVVDQLTAPVNNPWLARVRLSGHDFFDDGDRLAVCSWDGDVWLVSGLSTLDSSTPILNWQRIAAGLFQPLGLKIVAGDIYLTCRDQLVILRDQNGDGETDFYECFNNDHQVTDHFHEFAMGLQRDAAGNFYYAKSARHALKAIVPHHGTLLKVPSDGSRTEILATGFRAANGVCLNPDGSFIVTDQEGHWNPKNRINWVRKGGFYGNMFGYHDITDSSDDAMIPPLCWITNEFDRSPSELLWINDKTWGPLNGSLLNLSYGFGKVYVVPHEEVNGRMQGGMCQLPMAEFPTGTMRGRLNPHDHGLYLSGLFAWGSNQQTQDGGLFRFRPSGKPAYLPVRLSVRSNRIVLTFSDPLDTATANDTSQYSVKVWSLKRSANYGSKHYDERTLSVSAARATDDGRSIELTIPDLSPTWCMEIVCRLKSPTGEEVERAIHNSIHHLKD